VKAESTNLLALLPKLLSGAVPGERIACHGENA